VPKIDIAKAMVRTKGVYPEPWRAITEGREKTALGDLVGLTQFGVNLTRLKPGAASASTRRSATRSISRSARVPSVSGRTIPMSISSMTGTRAAFAFHAGRARRTRRAMDETTKVEGRAS